MTHEDELPEPQRARLLRASTPGQQAVGWMAWHAGELAAVAGPSLFAVAVTPWAWVATALTGGAWVVHEVRQTRSRRALAAEQSTGTAPVTSMNSVEDGASEHDEHEQTDEDVRHAGEIEVRHG